MSRLKGGRKQQYRPTANRTSAQPADALNSAQGDEADQAYRLKRDSCFPSHFKQDVWSTYSGKTSSRKLTSHRYKGRMAACGPSGQGAEPVAM